MPTPHISADYGEVAEIVLLPGDPLRAKYIAENYLSDVKQFNAVRNALGYTGNYMDLRISIMGTGMCCPSMGIYSYELIHFYGAKALIRTGSCGALADGLKLGDLVMAMGVSTSYNYAEQYHFPGIYSATASYRLLSEAVSAAEEYNIDHKVGNIYCSDVFYRDDQINDTLKKMGILAAEMESYALYCNAVAGGIDALTILTVTDILDTGESVSADQREKGLTNMMTVALATAQNYVKKYCHH